MTITSTRRGFIAGALALLAAPAVVRAESLMPVRRVFVAQGLIPCDGRMLRRADYPMLFAALGGMYGAPSPATFKVPDLRGAHLGAPTMRAAGVGHVLSLSSVIGTGLSDLPAGIVAHWIGPVPE